MRAPTLGPDLAAIGKTTPDKELIESILDPSQVIKKGYEPVTIATVATAPIQGGGMGRRRDRSFSFPWNRPLVGWSNSMSPDD
jgi:hypothetical protein